MADIELDNLRQRRDRADIVEGEAVAGMNLEPDLMSQPGGFGQPAQLFFMRGADRVGIGARMELDDMGADVLCRPHLPQVRADEHRDADAACRQLRYDAFRAFAIPDYVETAFRRALSPPLGHQADGAGR